MSRPRIEMEEFLTDPFAALARARREHWLAETSFSTAVIGHDAVRALLSEPRLRANFPEFLRMIGIDSGPFFDWMVLSPLNRDGEDHRRWRSVMSRTFTPRSVERIRPYLRTAAHELIDGFAERGGCELVEEFADQYPSLGLCELIGVPHQDRGRFRAWANAIGFGFSLVELPLHVDEVNDAITQLLAYTTELAERRRTEPHDDLVTRIAQAAAEDGWSMNEVSGAIAGLVFAGHETTKNQIGCMVASLAERSDLWDGVANGALEAREVVEEILRFRPAVTGLGRAVAESVTHEGETLEPGSNLFFSLLSAGHDEATYSQPERLDLAHNDQSPHLTFGSGPHHCLGAALARAELQEALAALTARLHCPSVLEGVVWKPLTGITGPVRLPITFRQRSAIKP